MAFRSTRKCKVCNNTFNILENDYVHFKGGVAEVECYINYGKDKGKTDEIIQFELNELLPVARSEKQEKIQKELEESKKKAKAKNREINRKKNLDNLIKYFSEVYNISFFPTYFYTKLAQMNNGTYKGVTSGVPYDDLLNMFKKKQGYLDKLAFNKSKNGEKFDGIQRLNYDIAVLINKYDEYLAWKNKQKIVESNMAINIEKENNEIKIDYKNIKQEKDCDMGIFDIVNDIY